MCLASVMSGLESAMCTLSAEGAFLWQVGVKWTSPLILGQYLGLICGHEPKGTSNHIQDDGQDTPYYMVTRLTTQYLIHLCPLFSI